jgi:hypothetical protein
MRLNKNQTLHLFKNGSKYPQRLIEIPEEYFFSLDQFSGFRFDRNGAERHPGRMIAYASKNGDLVLEPLYSNLHVLSIQQKKLKYKGSRFFVAIPQGWLKTAAEKDPDGREPVSLDVTFNRISAGKSRLSIQMICKAKYPEFPYVKQIGRKKFMVERPGKEYPI